MVSQELADFQPVETMDLGAGDISLDFANTASRRADGPPRERLHAYSDLVTWAERVGLVEEPGGERLRAQAAASPAEAAAVLERSRALREALYRLFSAPEQGAATDLELLSDEAGRAAGERRLVSGPATYAYAWPDTDRLDRLLWPVALSAADLLTSPERERVKECASDECGWLFLDMSRNRSRRWCDMSVCGNRAKARRFAKRQRDS